MIQDALAREIKRLMVFQNVVLRKILGPNRKEATGDWERLYKGQHHNFCSSSNSIMMTTSRIIRAGNVTAWWE
jgi:hypothetical protein